MTAAIGYRRARAGALVAGVAVLAATATAFVYATPTLEFAYPFPGVAVFAAALTSTSALVICVLFSMRHRRSRRRTDALVAAIFGSLALIEGVLPVLAQVEPGTADFAFWTRVIARTLVALGLCATAWLPERIQTRHRFAAIAFGALGLAAVSIGWTLATTSDLPTTVDDATTAGSALLHDPGMLGIRMAGVVLLLVAAIGLARKAQVMCDPVLDWLACGAILMATARVHDFIFPSLHNDWLTTGDTLRLFAEWIVLYGVLREFAILWQRRGADVRAQERRAFAAELHDGLAQELAYLTTQTALAERYPSNTEHLVRARDAAERALTETRLRITEYRETEPVALDCVIARVAHDFELRYDCRVVLDLEQVRVEPRTAHELARVACEAMTNAARHGHPEKIKVQLSARAGLVLLEIVDDGAGIVDDETHIASGFGLTAMRQRAERLGGRCSIESAPTEGTRVAIQVPAR